MTAISHGVHFLRLHSLFLVASPQAFLHRALHGLELGSNNFVLLAALRDGCQPTVLRFALPQPLPSTWRFWPPPLLPRLYRLKIKATMQQMWHHHAQKARCHFLARPTCTTSVVVNFYASRNPWCGWVPRDIWRSSSRPRTSCSPKWRPYHCCNGCLPLSCAEA